MTDRGLSGRTILITRPAGRADALAARLRDSGASVELRPTIAFEPPDDPGPSRRAVASLARYDWLVFTSPTGVKFFTALRQSERAQDAVAARIAAIGPGTARELAQVGLSVDVVAAQGDSEGLARSLAGRGVRGRRVLLVQPELARELLGRRLAEAGARVERAAFYRTVASPEAADAAARVAEGRFDVVVFSSPSTARFLLEAAGGREDHVREALGRAKRVAIGSVTAEALRRQGLAADGVALSPTDDAIAAAVAGLFDD